MVIDSSGTKRFPFLFYFTIYAIAVPSITVAGTVYHAFGDFNVAVFYGVQFAVFGLGCILFILWSRASHLARLQRIQERRKRTGTRSPWGQRRVAEPSPYSDRLATFLSANDNILEQRVRPHGLPKSLEARDEVPVRDSSRMPFWSTLDLPQEPYEAKPVWTIRRILMRIREAVASS